MSDESRNWKRVDARTFQRPLGELAETLAQKVKREAPGLLPGPDFVAVDLHVLMRLAMRTYDLLFYLNADERREHDCYWKPEYSIVALPLVRNMIDCFYNVTAILQDPSRNGLWFRSSGYRHMLRALDDDQARYGGRPEWANWIAENRSIIDFDLRLNNVKIDEVLTTPPWPTLGKYVSDRQAGGTFSPHQEFLKTFMHGRWREYSAIAHGAFEGLKDAGRYLAWDSMRHEDRPKIDDLHDREVSMHLARAAAILLCIITELQAHFHFEGAHINERIHRVWNALMPVFEVKELYDERYAQLMKETGINP